MLTQEEFSNNVRSNLHLLKDRILPKELADRLVAKKVLTPEQAHEIKAMTTKYDKNGLMLDILITRPEREIPIILECFQDSNQAHIADIISGKETALRASAADWRGTQCKESIDARMGNQPQCIDQYHLESANTFNDSQLAVIGGKGPNIPKIEVWNTKALLAPDIKAVNVEIDGALNASCNKYWKHEYKVSACYNDRTIHVVQQHDDGKGVTILQYKSRVKNWSKSEGADQAPRLIDSCILSVGSKLYIYGCVPGENAMILLELEDSGLHLRNFQQDTLITKFAVARSKNYLYVSGGKRNDTTLAAVHRVEASIKRADFEAMKDMLKRRSSHASIELDGYIYVCGGKGFNGEVLSSCERYSVNRNQWEPIPSMLTPRHSFSLVACNGMLVAIGGLNYDSSCELSSVEVYIPEKIPWSYAATSLKRERYDHASVVFPDLW